MLFVIQLPVVVIRILVAKIAFAVTEDIILPF